MIEFMAAWTLEVLDILLSFYTFADTVKKTEIDDI